MDGAVNPKTSFRTYDTAQHSTSSNAILVENRRSLSLSIALRRSAEEECRSTSSQWIAEEVTSTEEEENDVNEELGNEGMCDSRQDAIYHQPA